MHQARLNYPFHVAALVFTACLGYVLYKLLFTTQISPAREFWFDDVDADVFLSNDEADYIMRDIYRSVTQEEEDIQETFKLFPTDVSPQIVFISACDTSTRARVVVGTGIHLAAALRDAVVQLRNHDVDATDLQWLKLDIVKPSDANHAIPESVPEIELSLDGIAFPDRTALAILPTEAVAWRALDNNGTLLVENLPGSIQYQLAPLWRLGAARLSNSMRIQLNNEISHRGFKTQSFFFDGNETLQLSRGGRVPNQQITADKLLQAARQAGQYLRRSVLADGSFIYRYLPGSAEVADDYNLVRHAGTVYAMLELYEIDKNPELLTSAQLAIDYLLEHVRDYGNSLGEMSVLVSGKTIKLGGVALTVVALAKYTEVTLERKYLPVMARLANYIRDSQLDDGSFISQRYYPVGNVRKDFTSQYYPGEAMLALLRLYALEPDQTWLDTVEKAAHYLIKVRDNATGTFDLVHDHWLLYALNELYRYQPKYLYLTHALRITRAITLSQNQDTANGDYVGSYYLPPRSTPTATRTEGLLAAYRMARDADRLLDAEQMRETIDRGIGFQLRTQIGPEKAMYFEDPQQALGGFHKSFEDYEIRIDYVQHNLSAILGYYQLLLSDNGIL